MTKKPTPNAKEDASLAAVRTAVEASDSAVLGARISTTQYEAGFAARPHLGHYWAGWDQTVTLADALEKTRVPGADKAVAALIDDLVAERAAGVKDGEEAMPKWRAFAESEDISPRLATFTRALTRAWRGLVAAGATPPGPTVRNKTRVRHDESFIDVTIGHPFGCPNDHECFTANFDLNRADVAIPYTACTVHKRGAGPETCGTALGAVDAVLRILTSDDPTGATLRSRVGSDPSELVLAAFEELAVLAPPAPLTADSTDERLGWLIARDRMPILAWVREKKRGGGFLHRMIKDDREDVLGALTDPRDLSLFARIPKNAGKSDDPSIAASVTVGLIGRPNVFWRNDRVLCPVRVRLAHPMLALIPDPTTEAITPGLIAAQGGPPIDLTTTPFTAEIGDPLVVTEGLDPMATGTVYVGFWTSTAHHLATMLTNPTARRLRDDLGGSIAFAGTQRERLIAAAVTASTHVPVSLDETWLGEGWAPEQKAVIRLAYRRVDAKTVLKIELRVRPVRELGVFVAGDGVPMVSLARGGETGFVTRKLEKERVFIDRLSRALSPLEVDKDEHLADTFIAAELEEVVPLLGRIEELSRNGLDGWVVETAWETKPLKAAGTPTLNHLKLHVKGSGRDWLQAEGGFKVDGTELPLADLLAALRDNKRYVAVAGERFFELSEELRKKLEPLRTLTRRSGKLGTHPLALSLLDSLRAGGAEIDVPPDWQLQGERLRAAMTLSPEAPPELIAELRPYQLEGFRWLVRLAEWSTGAVLADDMGLGKTIQSIALLLVRRSMGPALVIAPTSVVPNWRRELATFAPSLKVALIQSGAEAPLLDGDSDVFITSYDVLVRNAEPFSARKWSTLILDEAHAIKNAATQRAKIVRHLDAAFVVALTGTPVENRPRELWSLLRVVAPGLLGSESEFQAVFGRPIEVHKDQGAAMALASLARPFILRRTKAEVATDLPDRTEIQVDVIFGHDERARYDRIRRAALASLKGHAKGGDAEERRRRGKAAMQILTVITRLRQLACHGHLVEPDLVPATTGASAKLTRLVELVEELVGEDRRTLIFSQFTEFLGLVGAALTEAGIPFIQLDGSTPAKKRADLIDGFQEGTVPVFLLSLKAGGVGLNLTAASEVILLDPWWNPAVEDQAADRAHRIGQEKGVTVYRFVVENTIEEKVVALHKEKRAMVASLLDGTATSASMTLEDIENLILMGDG